MVVIVVHDRSPSGGPALGEGESVIASNDAISIAFGGADPAGAGSLHVTTEYVRCFLACWHLLMFACLQARHLAQCNHRHWI